MIARIPDQEWNIRKRIQTLERSQSLRGGSASDQIARRVLETVSDSELGLLESATRAQAQGRELTPDEAAKAEAYISAFARESGSAGAVKSRGSSIA